MQLSQKQLQPRLVTRRRCGGRIPVGPHGGGAVTPQLLFEEFKQAESHSMCLYEFLNVDTRCRRPQRPNRRRPPGRRMRPVPGRAQPGLTRLGGHSESEGRGPDDIQAVTFLEPRCRPLTTASAPESRRLVPHSVYRTVSQALSLSSSPLSAPLHTMRLRCGLCPTP